MTLKPKKKLAKSVVVLRYSCRSKRIRSSVVAGRAAHHPVEGFVPFAALNGHSRTKNAPARRRESVHAARQFKTGEFFMNNKLFQANKIKLC